MIGEKGVYSDLCGRKRAKEWEVHVCEMEVDFRWDFEKICLMLSKLKAILTRGFWMVFSVVTHLLAPFIFFSYSPFKSLSHHH